MKNRFTVTMLVLVLASITSFSSPKELNKKVDEYSIRLELTDEQAKDIKPIMERASKEKKEILAQMENTDKKKEQRKLAKDLKRVNKETDKVLDNILTKDQSKEWKIIREEVEEQYTSS